VSDLLETTENGITTLTLNRPERLNALSPAMTEGLKEALERLSTDRDCGAIVITGAGRGWCAGGDVKTMESRGVNQSFEDRAEGLRRAHRLPLLLRRMPKVVIAMINGPVAGAGLGLALACDLVVAKDGARFGSRERAGMIYVDGVDIGDPTDVALRDRRMLSADGIFVVVATISEQDGASVADPEIIFRGVPYPEDAEGLLGDIRETVNESLERAAKEEIREIDLLQQVLHDDLATFVYDRLRRRPMVLPVVVEV